MKRKRKTKIKINITAIILCTALASIAVLLVFLAAAYLPVYIQVRWEEARTARIEAETRQIRVQTDSDNAKFIRDIAWVGVGFLLVSGSLNLGVIVAIAWHGLNLGDEVKKLGEKTRALMRGAK